MHSATASGRVAVTVIVTVTVTLTWSRQCMNAPMGASRVHLGAIEGSSNMQS